MTSEEEAAFLLGVRFAIGRFKYKEPGKRAKYTYSLLREVEAGKWKMQRSLTRKEARTSKLRAYEVHEAIRSGDSLIGFDSPLRRKKR